MSISELFKTDNWKNEKHVPLIESADAVEANENFDVTVTIGKEVAHPNTTAHHINWISLYFQPEGSNTPYQVAHHEFTAHGESPDGADSGPVYTHHGATATLKISKPGTLHASSLCNIHGLWESTKIISLK